MNGLRSQSFAHLSFGFDLTFELWHLTLVIDMMDKDEILAETCLMLFLFE